MVQLDTSINRKDTSYVKGCEILMNDFNTHADLNISPLSSYDMLTGMDWIRKHRVMLNCYDKMFTCIDATRNTIKVK